MTTCELDKTQTLVVFITTILVTSCSKSHVYMGKDYLHMDPHLDDSVSLKYGNHQ